MRYIRIYIIYTRAYTYTYSCVSRRSVLPLALKAQPQGWSPSWNSQETLYRRWLPSSSSETHARLGILRGVYPRVHLCPSFIADGDYRIIILKIERKKETVKENTRKGNGDFHHPFSRPPAIISARVYARQLYLKPLGSRAISESTPIATSTG